MNVTNSVRAVIVIWFVLMIVVGYLLLGAIAHAAGLDPLQEYRYTDKVVRLADGSIRRRADVLAAFQRIHPCPATLSKTGPCPGWQKNHVQPLACGGADAVYNLMWVRTVLKTCAGNCIDRYERDISAIDPPVSGSSCVNKVTF